jgi:uncharacterized protein YbbK (DUF523 family)
MVGGKSKQIELLTDEQLIQVCTDSTAGMSIPQLRAPI